MVFLFGYIFFRRFFQSQLFACSCRGSLTRPYSMAIEPKDDIHSYLKFDILMKLFSLVDIPMFVNKLLYLLQLLELLA